MIRYLSLLCLAFLALTHASLVDEDESQRFLRHSSSSSSSSRSVQRRKSARNSRASIAGIASDPDNAALFSTLVSVLGATGLDRVLDCRWSYWCSSYTVFAPTNDAFSTLAVAEPVLFEALTTDPEYSEHLKQLLLYHVVKGNIKSSDITTGPVKTLAGENLEVAKTGSGIEINTANVIDPFDIKAKNGRIHTVDQVLIPSFITDDIPTVASKSPDMFSTLVGALDANGLVGALSDSDDDDAVFTVFAPTNEAFAKLADKGINLDEVNVADILKYHVVEGIVLKSEVDDGRVPTLLGEEIRVSVEKGRRSCDIELNGDANVIATDVLARNGVIHVIDEVLIPPSLAAAARADLPDIVGVVSSNPDFSLLLASVSKFPDVVAALQTAGPFTVFAPTNKAFEELLEALGTTLDAVPEATLLDILQYHVLASGAFFSSDLDDSMLVNALNGKGIAIDARKGVQLNDNTHVIDADIEVSNGVIHVIDKVLIPPKNLVEVLSEDERFTTLVTAVSAAPGLAETLAERSPLTIFAPTNEAFQEVPEDTLTALLGDPDALENLLLYHVVGDFVPVQALERSLVTLANSDTISVRARRYWWWFRSYLVITLNGSVHVEDADLLASNGVIHAINGVLSPPE